MSAPVLEGIQLEKLLREKKENIQALQNNAWHWLQWALGHIKRHAYVKHLTEVLSKTSKIPKTSPYFLFFFKNRFFCVCLEATSIYSKCKQAMIRTTKATSEFL